MHRFLSLSLCGVICLLTLACGSGEPTQRGAAPKLLSPEAAKIVADVRAGKLPIRGKAHVAVLYSLDRPAHRDAVLAWLEKNSATVLYEDTTFGYLDAEMDWPAIEKLIETRGDLGLNETSMMKLELDITTAPLEKEKKKPGLFQPAANTSFTGPVHSAGYGAKVREFREQAARDFGVRLDDIAGQGITVAVFDSGIDMSRTDVFGNRLKDFVIGETTLWLKASATLEDFKKAQSLKETPKGLEDIQTNPTLRFTELDEETIEYDLNGSGDAEEKLPVAVYQNAKKEWEARVRVSPKGAFGTPVCDFGSKAAKGQARLINLYTGKEYVRTAQFASPSAGGFKFRVDKKGEPEAAFFGVPSDGAGHGIANLHMVGGDYAILGSGERLQGVAPAVDFLGVQSWRLDSSTYGAAWIPLARTILDSVKKGADVLDLDISTPGPRDGESLLNELLCRISDRTDVVAVVAAHNFSPLPNTVQSLAQSPCVLGIGAAHSRARTQLSSDASGMNGGRPDPKLTTDDALQTTFYSGRGFGLNGQYKPDVISPAYGYTAYNDRMTRFGGTSGATPTTAGVVALLKQAARRKGVELGLDQVRLLLQASSQDPGPQRLREGYGFTNLAAAWELFKRHNPAHGQFTLLPLRLMGHRGLFYDGFPKDRVIAIALQRAELKRGMRAAVPMQFSLRFGGSSTSVEWVKFLDPSSNKLTTAMELDSPLEGEQTALRLYFQLDPEIWGQMPAGDHIAIVEGRRSDLKEGRPADFLLPIVITKGIEIQTARVFSLDGLDTDQFHTLSLRTAPGDVLYVSGEAQCLGQRYTPGTSRPESLHLVAETEKFYAHAENKINPYRPLELSSVPLRLQTTKDITRLSIYRRSPLGCDGPVKPVVRIDRYSVQSEAQQMSWTLNQGIWNTTVDHTLRVPLDSNPEAVDGSNPTGIYQLKAVAKRWKLRQTITAANTLTAPLGLEDVRVLPANEASFQGLLTEFTPEGKHVREVDSTSQYAAGIGSLQGMLHGSFDGLSLAAPKQGNLISFAPASSKQLSTWELRIASAEIGASTVPTGARDKRENVSPYRALRFLHALSIPAQLPEGLAEFRVPGWQKYVELELVLTHGAEDHSGVEFGERTIWKDKITIPVP